MRLIQFDTSGAHKAFMYVSQATNFTVKNLYIDDCNFASNLFTLQNTVEELFFENITIVNSYIFSIFGQLMGQGIPSSSNFITYCNMYVESSSMDVLDVYGYIYYSLTSSTTFTLENIEFFNSTGTNMIYIEAQSSSNQFTFDTNLFENVTFSGVSVTEYVMYLKPNSIQNVILRNIRFIEIEDEVTDDNPIFYFENITNWELSNIAFSDFTRAQDSSPACQWKMVSDAVFEEISFANIACVSSFVELAEFSGVTFTDWEIKDSNCSNCESVISIFNNDTDSISSGSGGYDFEFSNSEISNNFGMGRSILYIDVNIPNQDVLIENVTFSNNQRNKSNNEEYNALIVISGSNTNVMINNCVFENNNEWLSIVTCLSDSYCNVTIKNSEFIDNEAFNFTSINGFSLESGANGVIKIINSRFKSNYPDYDTNVVESSLIYNSSDSSIIFDDSNLVLPTPNPTIMPSEPSHDPTHDPTQLPSETPTPQPTNPPTEQATTTQVTTSTGGDDDDDDDDDDEESEESAAIVARQELENGTSYVVFGAIGAAFVLFFVSYLFHQCFVSQHARGSDPPKYHIIGKFFIGLADLYTDLLFCIFLYFDTISILFGVSISFFLIPFTLQCVLAIQWINRWKKWRQDNPKRLHVYLQDYEALLYFLTITSGFYNAIDLVQSKLFYKKAFCFQLKQSEYNDLKKIRLINVVLLGNLPQFGIQLLYIFHFASKSETSEMSDTVSGIAYFSMTFTVLSILLALLSEMSRLIQKHQVQSGYPSEQQTWDWSASAGETKLRMTGVINIESSDLNYYHNFSHTRIETAIDSVLDQICDVKREWIGRDDVIYSINVYYIRDYINSLSKMEAFFEIDFKSFSGGGRDGQHSSTSALEKFLHSAKMMIQLIEQQDINVLNIFKATLCLRTFKNIGISKINVWQENNNAQTDIDLTRIGSRSQIDGDYNNQNNSLLFDTITPNVQVQAQSKAQEGTSGDAVTGGGGSVAVGQETITDDIQMKLMAAPVVKMVDNTADDDGEDMSDDSSHSEGVGKTTHD